MNKFEQYLSDMVAVVGKGWVSFNSVLRLKLCQCVD